MGLKSKVLAAGVTLALAGVPVAVAGTAGAATPSCGGGCIDVFSREFGTHSSPNYVLDVWRQGAKVGQPIILFRTSNTDPAEDIRASFQGDTSDFYGAGLVSSAVEIHYGAGLGLTTTPPGPHGNGFPDDPAFEAEYTPYGVGSGLCIGVGSTAAQGRKVSLQPCGASSKTVWIVDVADSPATIGHDYVPVINGSDTNFSHPYVLTYPADGFPTDKPRPQLITQELTGSAQGNGPVIGTVNDSQLWGEDLGELK